MERGGHFSNHRLWITENTENKRKHGKENENTLGKWKKLWGTGGED